MSARRGLLRRLLLPGRMASPGGLLRIAAAFALFYLAVHFLGWRQYTGFLSGTAPPAGSMEAGVARGLVYIAAYLGFVLLVPILVLAAFIMALVLRALRLLADR